MVDSGSKPEEFKTMRKARSPSGREAHQSQASVRMLAKRAMSHINRGTRVVLTAQMRIAKRPPKK